MTLKDLRTAYADHPDVTRNTKPRVLVNLAIREEIPGGAEAIELTTYLSGLNSREPSPEHGQALSLAVAVVDAMAEAIADRYQIGGK